MCLRWPACGSHRGCGLGGWVTDAEHHNRRSCRPVTEHHPLYVRGLVLYVLGLVLVTQPPEQVASDRLHSTNGRIDY